MLFRFLLIALLTLTVMPASAQPAVEKGTAIAEEAASRNSGWGDLSVSGEMILTAGALDCDRNPPGNLGSLGE